MDLEWRRHGPEVRGRPQGIATPPEFVDLCQQWDPRSWRRGRCWLPLYKKRWGIDTPTREVSSGGVRKLKLVELVPEWKSREEFVCWRDVNCRIWVRVFHLRLRRKVLVAVQHIHLVVAVQHIHLVVAVQHIHLVVAIQKVKKMKRRCGCSRCWHLREGLGRNLQCGVSTCLGGHLILNEFFVG